MKRSVLTLLICLCSLAGRPEISAAPARPAPVPAPDGHRFLFVVDMSSGMEDLKDEVETSIYDLLRSGVYGQMRTGDTYSLWTFNRDTQAGKFSMQVWEPRRATQLATIAAAYLSEQHYEKRSELKQMNDLVATVISAVTNLNVFVISDGSSAMRGTPFDKRINADYKKKSRDRRSAKRPYVTTLVARDGQIASYSVVISGQPIQLPERPLLPIATKTAAPAPAGVLLSNIVLAASSGPAPSSMPHQVQQPATAPPSNAPALAAPSPTVVSKQDVAPATVVPLPTKSNTVPAVAETKPAVLVEAGRLPSVAKPDQTIEPVASSEPTPAPASSVARLQAQEEKTAPHPLLAAIVGEPVVVAAREIDSESQAASVMPAPVMPVASLPMPTQPNATFLLAFGSLLMAAALFLLFIVFRRLRPAPGGSLITQSMERR